MSDHRQITADRKGVKRMKQEHEATPDKLVQRDKEPLFVMLVPLCLRFVQRISDAEGGIYQCLGTVTGDDGVNRWFRFNVSKNDKGMTAIRVANLMHKKKANALAFTPSLQQPCLQVAGVIAGTDENDDLNNATNAETSVLHDVTTSYLGTVEDVGAWFDELGLEG